MLNVIDNKAKLAVKKGIKQLAYWLLDRKMCTRENDKKAIAKCNENIKVISDELEKAGLDKPSITTILKRADKMYEFDVLDLIKDSTIKINSTPIKASEVMKAR